MCSANCARRTIIALSVESGAGAEGQIGMSKLRPHHSPVEARQMCRGRDRICRRLVCLHGRKPVTGRAAWHSILVTALVAWANIARPASASESERGYPVFPVVFFPPTAPIYGAKIDDRNASAARVVGGRRLFAPGGMADFVCDPFYPALSTRLFALDLSPALESRLHAYRSKRLLQVNALLNQFVTLHNQTVAGQEQQLREFAQIQTPLLVALEAEAERLSEELIADGFSNRIDWNAGRRWKVGAIRSGADLVDLEAEFQVVRATAFYQKGLTAQQRGLLRELATELQAVVRKARGLPAARTESDAMFFSPETTRIRLPSGISPALREKIGVYNGQKSALKRELRETIIAQENATPAARTRAFELLADKQWPHFGIMEGLAEEIRGLLGSSFELSAPSPPPWIPAGMLTTIRSYNEDRDSYFGELRQTMETAMSLVPRPDLNVSGDERVQVQREYAAQRTEARQRAMKEFQRHSADRFAELEQRYKAIREALTIVAEKQTDRKTGRPLDAEALLREYAASMEEFDTFGRAAVIYTNYRIAMLQPGLSPEQRRLLFGYALIGLAQPLPHGELMPRRNAKHPYPSW
jgi:hypothetical protein